MRAVASCQSPVAGSSVELHRSRLRCDAAIFQFEAACGLLFAETVATGRSLAPARGRTKRGKYSGGNHRNLDRLWIRRGFRRLLLQEAIEEAGIHLRGAKIRIAQECAGTAKYSS